MAAFRQFEDIDVWKQGRVLASRIYAVARTDAFSRDYGLRDQIQRAVVSISSNIAEGYERAGNKEFIKFLWIAKGSAGEVASQLYIAYDNGYIDAEQFRNLHAEAKAIGARIYCLIKSLTTSNFSGPRYNLPKAV